jgi:hypothetical protein
MIQRHRFDISTDTGGDFVDTGPPIHGMIYQVACDSGAFDTGVDFKLETVQSKMTILDWDNHGQAAQFSGCPRNLTYDTGGAQIGDQPFVVASDRLRLTVNQSDGATGSKTAKFYVWTDGN